MKHKHLVEHALRYLKKCTVFCSASYVSGPERPDAIGWMMDGMSVLLEAKSSRKDLLAEWSREDRKAFRKRPGGMGVLRSYITPPGIVKDVEVEAYGWGLIEVHGKRYVQIAESQFWKPDLKSELRFLANVCSKVKIAPEIQTVLPFPTPYEIRKAKASPIIIASSPRDPGDAESG